MYTCVSVYKHTYVGMCFRFPLIFRDSFHLSFCYELSYSLQARLIMRTKRFHSSSTHIKAYYLIRMSFPYHNNLRVYA